MPGSFLEFAVPTQDVVASIAFYESLGFVQAAVGDAWPHAYAVVTDGRLSLGLHGTDLPDPLLTFTVPGLRSRLAELDRLGIDVEQARLDDGALHEVMFRDPAGCAIRLLEARTFSPPPLAPGHESRLGYFEECAIGCDDPAAAGRFWEALGFVAFADGSPSPAKVVASRRDLNLAFHDADLPAPLLCFSSPDVATRVATLRDDGCTFARRLPRGYADAGSALLQAPDGLQILLVTSAA